MENPGIWDKVLEELLWTGNVENMAKNVQNMVNIFVGYQEALPAIVKRHKASLIRPCSQD